MKITQPQIPSHGSQWALGSAPHISFLLSRCTRLICSQRVQTPPRGPTNAVFFSALPTQPKSLCAFHDSSRWTLINVPEATCSSKERKPSGLAARNHIPRLVFPTIRCLTRAGTCPGPSALSPCPGAGSEGSGPQCVLQVSLQAPPRSASHPLVLFLLHHRSTRILPLSLSGAPLRFRPCLHSHYETCPRLPTASGPQIHRHHLLVSVSQHPPCAPSPSGSQAHSALLPPCSPRPLPFS